MPIRVDPLNVSSTEQLHDWHQVLAAVVTHDRPGEPVPSLGEMTNRLTGESLSTRRSLWLASSADGTPVGTAVLRLFTDSGQAHLAELDLQTHPEHRRRGVGSLLLEAAVAAARADGRRSVIAAAVAGTPGDRFLPAQGFRPVLALTFTRLPLDTVDVAALAAEAGRPHPGYHLESWDGTVPPLLAETYVLAKHAMDDMPMDDTDYGTVDWDLDRVRASAEVIGKRGELLHTVAAIRDADGSMAGFTELVIPGDGAGDAQHYGTGVLAEHRGHGLGRWMKYEAIRLARQRYPGLGGLLADTADSNTWMRAINDELGYRPIHRTIEYQLALTDAG